LTGLYNRIHFEKVLKEKISESDRYHNLITLMFIDIDNFKNINDHFGHHVGDLLLREFASRLKKCIRLEDFAARLGGDEFVIVFTHLDDEKTAGDVANKIVNAVAETYHLDQHDIRVSASIGIAFYPYPGVNYHTLIQNADIAMYHAKSKGKSNYQFYSENLSEKYRKHINLEHELKFALDRKQIVLNFQPICDGSTLIMDQFLPIFLFQSPKNQARFLKLVHGF
jgi:diguanylate cyclase